MKSWNWKRWATVAGGALVAGLSTAIPPTAVITIPLLGVVSVAKFITGAGGILFGWGAMHPPGTKKKRFGVLTPTSEDLTPDPTGRQP